MTEQEVRSIVDKAVDQAKEDILAAVEQLYVGKDDCNDTKRENAKKFANDDKRIELFEQKMKLWEGLFKIIASASIGQVVLSIANLLKG